MTPGADCAIATVVRTRADESFDSAVWMALTPLMAGLTSLIGQQYLISRYLRASKQRIMAYVRPLMLASARFADLWRRAVLSTCSLAGFGFCLWAFIVLVKLADGNLSVESQLRTAGRLVNSTTAAVDITVRSHCYTRLSLPKLTG